MRYSSRPYVRMLLRGRPSGDRALANLVLAASRPPWLGQHNPSRAADLKQKTRHSARSMVLSIDLYALFVKIMRRGSVVAVSKGRSMRPILEARSQGWIERPEAGSRQRRKARAPQAGRALSSGQVQVSGGRGGWWRRWTQATPAPAARRRGWCPREIRRRP